jgi:hypothetical protein
MEILDQNGSVAKHLYMHLFSSKIEDRINGLFSTPRPQITGLASENKCGQSRPSWVNLIQESINKDHFGLFNGYRYRCSFRGISVEMSESDCDAFSSHVLRKLSSLQNMGWVPRTAQLEMVFYAPLVMDPHDSQSRHRQRP